MAITKTPFLSAYIEAALWSSTDGDGEPLDGAKYADAELAEATLAKFAFDCDRFEQSLIPILAALDDVERRDLPPDEQFAHDFWLTRNRHGAGFWDGDYPEALGKTLTDLAHSFGECDLYVSEDMKIYC